MVHWDTSCKKRTGKANPAIGSRTRSLASGVGNSGRKTFLAIVDEGGPLPHEKEAS